MKSLPLILFLIFSFEAAAQKLNAEIDALLKTKYKPGEPGAVALVAKAGKPIYRQAFGMANLEHDILMKPEHVFEIGSITKQFTAVAILMLEEQRKLSLQDPVTKFIKDYPVHGHTITVHHLLTHTSGIKSYTGMERWMKLWRNDMSPPEMIDLFKNEPMDFAPGEKWLYNNSGYFMLGYIIEKASGMPYGEFLEKNIFTPLGMKNSYLGTQSKIIRNRAQGYQKREGFINAEYLSLTQPYAAGSVLSTVDDLLIWNTAVKSNRLVKKETIQKAFTNYKLNDGKATNYGYGWALDEINGSPTVEHSGGIFGFTTNGIYLPNEDVYVVVLDNCDCQNPSEISTRIAAMVIGKPYPEATSKIKLDDTYASSLTGVFVFEDSTTRMVTWEDGQLFSQRTGGEKFKLFPQDKFNFVFENSLTQYQFVVDNTGVKGLLFKNRVNVVKGVRSDMAVPSHREIVLSEEEMKPYAGVFEIQPNFLITVTVEGNHLMAQATGQNKFEIFPESPDKFFYKVVDAQIEYIRGDDGKYDSFILYQGGQKVVARRKN